ncbi:hypothetical protein AGR1A_Lc50128 [Agrobacterium fabacearum CFBP 5771]|nr:hypothetical protein AGR1A_Lc50128 [Agrobacterium fabacearum CFBP 5771]
MHAAGLLHFSRVSRAWLSIGPEKYCSKILSRTARLLPHAQRIVPASGTTKCHSSLHIRRWCT